MTNIVFPSALPNPSVSIIAPADRRLLSDVTGGPQQSRGVQRDYLALESVQFRLSPAQAIVFDDWWRSRLRYGGCWFASNWPLPAGWLSTTRRFSSTPRWLHQPGGDWIVSAQTQLRGRGLPPAQLDFTVNLNGVTNAGTSSAVGVSISGLIATAAYRLTMPDGGLYGAWSATSLSQWENGRLQITTSGGTTTRGSPSATIFATPQLARDAFNALNETITGYSDYRFWIVDTPTSDNMGGLSILVEQVF